MNRLRSGVKNFGHACFMISVLQIFASCESWIKLLFTPGIYVDEIYVKNLRAFIFSVHNEDSNQKDDMSDIQQQYIRYLLNVHTQFSVDWQGDDKEVSF